MQIWTIASALVLLFQGASAGYTPDWDSVGVTLMSSGDDVKQSYGGVSAEAGTVKAPAYSVSANDDGDDGDAVAAPASEAATPSPAAPVPETDAPSPVMTPALILKATDDSDDDDSEAPAASAPEVESPAPETDAPVPILMAAGNDEDDGGDDTNTDDNDGDDDGAPLLLQGKPYEQNDNYNSVKQTSGGGSTPQAQTDLGGDSRPSVNNGGVNLYPYTQDLRDYIVQTHNWARGNLAPSQAANMRQLSWDESLAIEASELVNTCVFEHDTENYAYGQNLMYGGFSLDRAMIDGWMDGWVKNELSEYDRAGTGFMDLDHASAVLWANSYLVGCASKMCPNGYLSACNYYTPGNWQGEAAYIPGPTCSQCPAKAPYCDSTGKLCTADPTGATPTSKPNPAQSAVQTAAPVSAPASAKAPASAPVPTPAKSTVRPAAVPAPTLAKTTANGGKATASPKVAPAPTPKVTIPNELFCV